MPEPRFTSEDIIDLAEQLRRARFNIGLQQYFAAEDLMIALLTQGRLPEDPRKWKSLLGPIFCSNPMEQEQFPQLFDAWLSRKPNLVKRVEDAKQAELAEAPPPIETVPIKQPLSIADVLNWVRRRPAWSAAFALTLAALLTAGLMLKIDRHLEGQVFSQSDGKELPGAEVSFLGQKTTTDANGRFSIPYQIRVYEWVASTRVEQFQVAHIRHYLKTGLAVLKDPPKPSITLEVRPEELPVVPIPGPVPPIDTQTPPKEETSPVQRLNYRRPLLAALIPLLALLAFLLVRWIRRRMMLRKMETAGTPQLHKVTFKREDAPMFVSSPFRRAAQELRRHSPTSHSDLDIAATVNATIQKGMFTPAYAARRAAPEYLLLIDRASVDDGQARLADELAKRLGADNVYVDQFYFQDDARTLREPKPLSPVVTLHELASRYPDHRLLVFSDALGFFNPFTGKPGDWLEQFDYWQQRILLTPESVSAWGYREFTLAEQYGFTLIPAKTAGLAALANLLNFDLSPDHSNDDAPQLPELIARDPERWLDSREPKPEVAEKLCAQLKSYLGGDGWLWLAACAVYPQIKWEITLYLGGRLAVESQYPARQQGVDASSPLLTRGVLTREADWAESVLRLVRLPWFRFGRMPDWMRDRLIADFSAEQDSAVRRIVTDLLSHVTKDITQPLTLDFAEPEPPLEKWKAFKQRLSERYKQWRQHRQFYRLFQAQEADSPLRDFVFLRFLAGQSRKRLGVKPPDLLRRILFNEGVAALGLRATTLSLAALALAGILMFVLWPKPLQPPKPDDLLAKNSPTPTATPNETITPTPAISPTATPRDNRTPRPNPTTMPNVVPNPVTLPSIDMTLKPVIGGSLKLPQIEPPIRQGDSPSEPPVKPSDKQIPAAPAPQSVFSVRQTAEGYSVDLGKGVKQLELVSLKGGQFTMGSYRGDFDERPPYSVKVSPFAIGKFEVTQSQWMAVMGGKNPSRFKDDKQRDNLPVESVSWNDVQQFIKRLNDLTGSQQFRLPTEAEWEYAARAGTDTEYSFGNLEVLLGDYGWYSENSAYSPHAVGLKRANGFNLFDMYGNLWEWCSDRYIGNYYMDFQKRGTVNDPQGPVSGSYRVIRGGSWNFNAVACRSANRNNDTPGTRANNLGFRLVRIVR